MSNNHGTTVHRHRYYMTPLEGVDSGKSARIQRRYSILATRFFQIAAQYREFPVTTSFSQIAHDTPSATFPLVFRLVLSVHLEYLTKAELVERAIPPRHTVLIPSNDQRNSSTGARDPLAV